jgi:hypothetical protein|tara:strand:- start:141 stop:359 length:219 start_codon:yes stop_codon:yes gene_type:complete
MSELISKPFMDREDYWEGRHMEVEATIKSMIEVECLGQELCKLLKSDKDMHDDYIDAVTTKILMYEWEESVQ